MSILLSWRGVADLPLLRCGLCIVTFSKEYGKRRERATANWRDLTVTTAARWSRWTSPAMDHLHSMYLEMMGWRWPLTSVTFLTKLSTSVQSWEKQIPVKEYSTKCWTKMAQNCRNHQKQGKPENCPSQEPEETMTTKCDKGFWMRSWDRKWASGENWVKYGL